VAQGVRRGARARRKAIWAHPFIRLQATHSLWQDRSIKTGEHDPHEATTKAPLTLSFSLRDLRRAQARARSSQTSSHAPPTTEAMARSSPSALSATNDPSRDDVSDAGTDDTGSVMSAATYRSSATTVRGVYLLAHQLSSHVDKAGVCEGCVGDLVFFCDLCVEAKG
jgi:hypothetical protein